MSTERKCHLSAPLTFRQNVICLLSLLPIFSPPPPPLPSSRCIGHINTYTARLINSGARTERRNTGRAVGSRSLTSEDCSASLPSFPALHLPLVSFSPHHLLLSRPPSPAPPASPAGGAAATPHDPLPADKVCSGSGERFLPGTSSRRLLRRVFVTHFNSCLSLSGSTEREYLSACVCVNHTLYSITKRSKDGTRG